MTQTPQAPAPPRTPMAEYLDAELTLAGYFTEDQESPELTELYRRIGEATRFIVETLATLEADYPTRAHIPFRLAERLTRRIGITPLLCEEDQWVAVGDEGLEVHIRCARVVRVPGEEETLWRYFDREGKAFKDPTTGRLFYAPGSEVEIGFPYMVPLEPYEVVVGMAVQGAEEVE